MPQSKSQHARQQSARARLAALREKKAPTKAARIRELWPEIKAALENGHSLKEVCDCLEADGITVTIQTLGSYITRIRRESIPVGRLATPSPATIEELSVRVTNDENSGAKKSLDPLANTPGSRAKRAAFNYRPELADPKDLI